MTAPFVVDGSGISVILDSRERAFLRHLPGLLDGVGDAGSDPAGERLDPAAYPDDPEADGEFRRLTGSEMDAVRQADRSCFTDTLDHVRLTEVEASAWVRVIGEARLALAARCGVVTAGSEWERRIHTEPELALVGWLGHVQGSLVEVMMRLQGGGP